jgi:hypothetical protein
MVDQDTHSDAERIAAFWDNLRSGKPVKQSDLAEIVTLINNAHRSKPLADFTPLTSIIMARATEGSLRLEPDKKLADDLKELRRHTLGGLRLSRRFIRRTDCNYQPRDPEDIASDEFSADVRYALMQTGFNILFVQVSPSEQQAQ